MHATYKSHPPSLYTVTARGAPKTSKLQGKRHASVAIVGGGYTGLSAALHLAQGGIDAVLVEAHEIGWGASGRNGGQVNPGLKVEPQVIEGDFGTERGRKIVAASYEAPQLVFDLVRRYGIDCAASQSGTLRVAFQQSQAGPLAELYRQCRERDMPVEYLEADELAKRTGASRYVAGLFDTRGGHLNPLGYVRGLAEAAIGAGATIHTATPALKLEKCHRGWKIVTPGGDLTADQVILATNGYTDRLWPKLSRTIIPLYSAIAASEPLPAHIAASVMPSRSALYEVGQITVYYRLDDAGRLVIGGRSWSHDVTDVGSLGFLTEYSKKLWPALEGTRWQYGWNGQLALTVDHYPHVHRLDQGVWACLGYNGRGVAMATLMGKQLAAAMTSGTDAVMLPLTVPKAIAFHRFWKLGVGARILYGRLRDRIG